MGEKSKDTLKNNLRSQTPLARRQLQSENREPGTVRRQASTKFRVTEKNAPKETDKSKKKKKGAKVKASRITPDVISPDISEEEIKQIERAKKEKELKKKAAREKLFNNFLFRALLVLIVFAAIMLVIIAVIFFIWLPSNRTGNVDDYILYTGSEKNYETRNTVKWSVARNGNVLFVDMTEIAGYCGLATTGDGNVIRYIVKNSMDDVVFTVGDGVAVINGCPVRLDANVFVSGSHLYVPMSFVNNYMNGVTSAVGSTKNRIYTLRGSDTDGNDLPISFSFSKEASSAAINFESLDKDLQNEIILRQQINDPTDEGGDILP